MRKDLFNETLTEAGENKIEIYDLQKMFFVAFLGGIIPTAVLGIRDAKKLKLSKNIMILLSVLAAIILIGKLAMYIKFLASGVQVNRTDFKSGRLYSKIAVIIFYLIYYKLIKDKYHTHIAMGGKIKPILKDAIIWSLVGGLAEMIFVGIFVGGRMIYGS
ncbi:hypothetical protein [Clostridium cellulovorans]|uniref:Uncharacterized protein n=1 Tax=Clostridium cellulovorans (strain ATCC 35296 / DSM 3052 / OCM 3 / 743B) TaxID=573061 RepID=D9SU23_CLOC7|nr:hypothetical protein [Clostridium cellulovorans]ADL50861.1 hypothetical protein Clocel_1102 [Clostridium cellulovorans 743B]